MVLGKKHCQKDYEWGRKQEEKCNVYLNEHFNTTLINAKSQYEKWDFQDGKIRLEMKSRKGVSFDTYDTTYISEDKIKQADENTFFIFNFVYDLKNDLSDLYCIQYSDKFKHYKRKQLYNDFNLVEIPTRDLVSICIEEII